MTQEQQEVYDAVMAALQENAKTIADLSQASALPTLSTTFVELSNGSKISLEVLLGGGLSLYEKKTEASAMYNKITGKAADSSAQSDAQLVVGDGTWTWAQYNNYLDAIGSTTAVDEKNNGWLVLNVGGAITRVLCQVIGYGNQQWTQIAFGAITLESGKLAKAYSPHIYMRGRDNSGWSAWELVK